MTTVATIIGRGNTDAKPAAAAVPVGSLYFDTTLSKLQRSTGAAWEDCAESGGTLTVREVDTSPSVTATVLEFPNGTLSDQGSGVARYTPSGGGGYTEGARVHRETAQSIGHLAWVAVQWTVEDYDTNGCFDSESNTRLTCQTSGKYLVHAGAYFAPSTSGLRCLKVIKNGSDTPQLIYEVRNATNDSSLRTTVSGSMVYSLGIGDYLECYVYQNLGGSLNLDGDTYYQPYFELQRIG